MQDVCLQCISPFIVPRSVLLSLLVGKGLNSSCVIDVPDTWTS